MFNRKFRRAFRGGTLKPFRETFNYVGGTGSIVPRFLFMSHTVVTVTNRTINFPTSRRVRRVLTTVYSRLLGDRPKFGAATQGIPIGMFVRSYRTVLPNMNFTIPTLTLSTLLNLLKATTMAVMNGRAIPKECFLFSYRSYSLYTRRSRNAVGLLDEHIFLSCSCSPASEFPV